MCQVSFGEVRNGKEIEINKIKPVNNKQFNCIQVEKIFTNYYRKKGRKKDINKFKNLFTAFYLKFFKENILAQRIFLKP